MGEGINMKASTMRHPWLRTIRNLSLFATAMVAPILACGGKDKPADTGGLNANVSFGAGSTSASASTAPPPTAAASTTPAPSATGPLAPTTTNDPNQLAILMAQAAAAASAMMQNPGVAGDPIEAGIRLVAAKQAPGMQPDSPIAKGQPMREGDHVTFIHQFQPGRCYTVVGFSPAGNVVDLDLNLLAPPFFNMLAGQDASHDSMPVIGSGRSAMCPALPMAVPYKIDMVAKRGAGIAGAQVFSRPK